MEMEEVILREPGKKDKVDADCRNSDTSVSLRFMVWYDKKWGCSPSGFYYWLYDSVTMGSNWAKVSDLLRVKDNRALITVAVLHTCWCHESGTKHSVCSVIACVVAHVPGRGKGSPKR